MNKTTDVVIIGGGVIGGAIAYYLRKSNIDVTILEQGDIGGQASGAAAGLLAPLGPLSGPGPFADLVLASFALFPSLVPELEDASGMTLGYEQTGALRIITSPKRVSHLRKRLQNWQPLGLKMNWLTGDEARQLEPALGPDISAAIYAPEESQINASQLVKAFSQAASRLGAKIYSHTRVTGIHRNNTKITGVQMDRDEIACSSLVIATGAWTACYEKWFNTAIPVRPLQGQMLSLKQPRVPLQHIIFGNAIYLVPRGSNILVGATKEETGFDMQVTDKGISWLHTTALKLLPALRTSKIEHTWAGLCPKTPDNQPILGSLPNWENVILATGHNSVGILLSVITGQAIADLIRAGKMSPVIKPFSFERYVEKQLVG
jgi:glycine oxidase